MRTGEICYSDTRRFPFDSVLALYRANALAAAEKPEQLHRAIVGSHSLITAWDGEELVGLGNALSDGALVVYYSHILVLPAYQRRGIGTEIMRRLMGRYQGFHQHVLICSGRALKFYEKCGFTRATRMHSM